METKDYLRFISEIIHTTIVATVDDDNLPVTAAIDMMHSEENSLYFLTAKGKSLYQRLIKRKFISLTAVKGEEPLSSVSVSLRGKVREIGYDLIPFLFEKNPYMKSIYPTEESRLALTVFQLYEGSGQWFDLSKKPIEHFSFTFGGTEAQQQPAYFIDKKCNACGSCLKVCPQNCIENTTAPFKIRQNNCLNCGNCISVCPVGAVVRKSI